MAPLLLLLNRNFCFQYKLGRVIPLLKKLGFFTKDPANYRPITKALTRLRPHNPGNSRLGWWRNG